MPNTDPVVLFPLRLEIYNEHGPAVPGAIPHHWTTHIRWYPDESQIYPHVSGLSQADEEAHQEYQDGLNAAAQAPYTKQQNARQTAWRLLVKKVGINRARQLVGKQFVKASKRFYRPADKPALHQFMEEGSPLKILPERVLLFTLRRNAGVREVKFLERGCPIPRDLVFSIHDQNNPNALNWLFDFQEAVKVGMGVTITEPTKIQQLIAADWLFAVGCKEDQKHNDFLEELLLRYKSVGGLTVLAQDTPTNNTENVSAAFISNKNGTANETEALQDPVVAAAGATGANLLSAALGLEPPVLAGVSNAELKEQRFALAMNRLLWYVCTRDHRDALLNFKTAGGVYHFREHFDDWRWLADHFMHYVFGRGPLPSVRLGDNPYGILPVTDLEKWEPWSDVNGDRMAEMLVKVCRVMKKKALKLATGEQVASYYVAGLDDVQPDRKLMTLLQILQHNAVSERVDVQKSFGEGDKEFWSFDADPQQLLSALVPGDDGLKGILGLRDVYHAFGQHGFIADGQGKSISSTFQADLTQILPKISLLEWLLRVQLLYLEYDCNQFESKGNTDVCKFLKAHAGHLAYEFQELRELTSEQLKTVFLEVLDCLSHRLDAWMTSMAHRRLAEVKQDGSIHRRAGKHNYVGAYGWLEKPFAYNHPSHTTNGYFQAPSLNQATAGVLLRNAALNGVGGKAFQTNLSSERARKAIWFAEGLQNGFTAAELLGYRAERFLHDHYPQVDVPALRKAFPLRAQAENGTVAKGGNVINGEALIENPNAFASLGTDVIDAVRQELLKVRDAYSDLCISEAVYQTVRGNAPRAAAWLEAAEGKNVPPEQEVLATPRTGLAKVQKLIMPLTEDPQHTDSKNPRVVADPVIAAFCATEMLPFEAARFKVTVFAREPRETVYVTPLSLREIGMEPIDLVAGGKPELETRTRVFVCEHFVRHARDFQFLGKKFFDTPLPHILDECAFLEFEYDYPVNGKPLSADMLAKADCLRLFLTGVRPFTLDDVVNPKLLAADPDYLEQMFAKKLQTYELLQHRCESLATNFEADFSHLEKSFNATKTRGEKLETLLQRISKYGIAEACIPPHPELLAPVLAALKANEARLTGLIEYVTLEGNARMPLDVRLQGDIVQQRDPNSPQGWADVPDIATRLAAADAYIKAAVALLKKRTHDGMPVVPPVFLIDEERILPPKPGGVDDGQGFSVSFLNKALSEYAHVRNSVDMTLRLFPRGRAGDGSVRLLFTRTGIQRSRKEALVQAFGSASKAPSSLRKPAVWAQSNIDVRYIVPDCGVTLDAKRPFTILRVDEWNDFLANPEETTAVAFHYAGPRNEAPHALLIAVPPKGEWRQDPVEELAGVLAETVDLMKLRTLTGEMVVGSSLGYLLPAMMFFGDHSRLPSQLYSLHNKAVETGFAYKIEPS